MRIRDPELRALNEIVRTIATRQIGLSPAGKEWLLSRLVRVELAQLASQVRLRKDGATG
jgi:hypothetical protein